MYRLLLHPSVIQKFQNLPDDVKASVLREFVEIKRAGVTSLLPGRLLLDAGNGFTVFAPKRHFSVGMDDGAILHGFWDNDFDGRFYIFDLKAMANGKCDGKKGYQFFTRADAVDRPEDRKQYLDCSESWLDDQLSNPEISEAANTLNRTDRSNADDATFLEEVCAYKFIDHFFKCFETSERLGTARIFASPFPSSQIAWHTFEIRFPKTTPDPKLIDRHIADYLKTPNTLVFVHFKDESDPLCHAQSDFINTLSFYLQQDHETLTIKIISVVIRSQDNLEGYQSPFREYFSRNMLGPAGRTAKEAPSPFVMVCGNPTKEALGRQCFYTRTQKNRLFDFDLFHGCREMLEQRRHGNFQASDRYKRNLRRALHETHRFAGMIVKGVRTVPRDYRGMPQEYADEALWRMENNGMVIKVHTEERYMARTAIRLACHLRSSGCPYVTVALCDGPKDIIEVFDDTDTYSEFKIPDGCFTDENDGDDLFWSVESVVRQKYAGHTLNGASPLVLKPDVLNEIHEPHPEIFKTLKKPLH